jgi:uncharacterized protein with HEPN domain
MTKHDDTFYLEGVEEHVVAIRKYLPPTKAAFLADDVVQDAILMRLLAIGEEIVHLSDAIMQKYPAMQWHKIIGLRNRIVHGYFEVDKDTIWETLTDGSLEELQSIVTRET